MKRLAQKILQCLRYVWMHEEPIAQQSATIKKPMFFDSEITICRSLIGMKKKNLFNVKYASVYLMLNALMMKSYDYKSIALPAELQGHLVNGVIFSLKDQINQSLKDIVLARLLLQPRPNVQGCRTFVPNLSVFLSVFKSVFIQDFINTFNFIKTNKSWSGIYEKEQRQINKVY